MVTSDRSTFGSTKRRSNEAEIEFKLGCIKGISCQQLRQNQ
jgi:hypothetical protein